MARPFAGSTRRLGHPRHEPRSIVGWRVVQRLLGSGTVGTAFSDLLARLAPVIHAARAIHNFRSVAGVPELAAGR